MVVRLVTGSADNVYTADSEVSVAVVTHAANQVTYIERVVRVIGRPQSVIRRGDRRRLLVVNSHLEITAWPSRARTGNCRFADREE